MKIIVLVHGFLGFNKLFNIEYFNGVADYLRTQVPSLKVLVPQLDPDAPISERAQQLFNFIKISLGSKFASEKMYPAPMHRGGVHIIAHSMGGLDSRYLISSPTLQGYRFVRSLTTLGTPHWGTPAAEWLIQMRNRLYAPSKKRSAISHLSLITNRHIRYLLDVLCPFDGGIYDMTYGAMERFNKTYPNRKEVSYFSYAGASGPKEGDILCPLLVPSHRLIIKCKHPKIGGRNDGLVSIESAKGKGLGKGKSDFHFLGVLSADHCDLIGHDLSFSNRLIKYSRGKPRSILLREELLALATPCVGALSSPQQATGYSRAVIKRWIDRKNRFDHLQLYKSILVRIMKL